MVTAAAVPLVVLAGSTWPVPSVLLVNGIAYRFAASRAPPGVVLPLSVLLHVLLPVPAPAPAPVVPAAARALLTFSICVRNGRAGE